MSSNFAQFIPLILIFFIFYFFLIRPQQKKVREHKTMTQNLKRGDEVITSGGIIGTVDRVFEDDRIELNISDGVKVQVIKNTIQGHLKKETKETIEENKSIISHGKLKLDPSQLECEWNGKQLPDKLTTTEFLLVKELAKRPGIIKERAQLMDIAYREDTDIEDRTIDSHVKRIRKKFKKVDPDFSAIETRYGSGYRWNVS